MADTQKLIEESLSLIRGILKHDIHDTLAQLNTPTHSAASSMELSGGLGIEHSEDAVRLLESKIEKSSIDFRGLKIGLGTLQEWLDSSKIYSIRRIPRSGMEELAKAKDIIKRAEDLADILKRRLPIKSISPEIRGKFSLQTVACQNFQKDFTVAHQTALYDLAQKVTEYEDHLNIIDDMMKESFGDTILANAFHEYKVYATRLGKYRKISDLIPDSLRNLMKIIGSEPAEVLPPLNDPVPPDNPLQATYHVLLSTKSYRDLKEKDAKEIIEAVFGYCPPRKKVNRDFEVTVSLNDIGKMHDERERRNVPIHRLESGGFVERMHEPKEDPVAKLRKKLGALNIRDYVAELNAFLRKPTVPITSQEEAALTDAAQYLALLADVTEFGTEGRDMTQLRQFFKRRVNCLDEAQGVINVKVKVGITQKNTLKDGLSAIKMAIARNSELLKAVIDESRGMGGL